MISPEDAKERAATSLAGYPLQLVEQYLAFAQDRDLARLDAVVLGVLQFHLANPPAEPLAKMPGSTRLVDLGCDSLAMIDMLFVAQDILGITITDDELSKVTTLEDVRAHFRRHVIAAVAAA